MDFRGQMCFLFLLCCSMSIGAQWTIPDSLEQKLARARSLFEKAEIYYRIGDRIAIHDTVKALGLIRKGLSYAKEDPLYEGIGYFYLGRVYMDFSREKADAVLDTAIRFLERNPSSESFIYQNRSWANKAVIAQLNGDNRTYIDLFLEKAIPLAAKGGDSLRMADGYANIALPFMNYGEYEKAILYLNRAAAMFKRIAPQDLRQVDVYCHLAKIYLLQGEIGKAGENLEQASAVLKQDAESIYAPIFHTTEGMYLTKLQKWEEAEKTVEKGLAIAEKQKNRYDIRQLRYQQSALFGAQQNWPKAKEVLLKMYHEGYIELITDKKQLFSDMAILEQHLGNYQQAYEWMQKQQEVSEEIYDQETKAKIADLEAKYNYVQKEKELLIAEDRAKKQQVLVWTTILVFTFILTLTYFWFRNKRLRTVQEIQNLKQQQRIELGKALLEGEEKERSRLARDLHDGLGGMLAGIRLNLSQMAGTDQQLRSKDLAQTIDRLGHSVSELRRIARNMMPESLLRSGLEVALKDLCDDATLPGFKVNFTAFNLQEYFSPQVKVMIYRIVQELVYNAMKHANASKVMVQCSQSDNFFFLTVEDNGKGFSPEHIPITGRGLKNVRNRVELLNGKMDMESSQEGTNINIELYVGQ